MDTVRRIEKTDRHIHAAIVRKRTARAQRLIEDFSQVGSSSVVLPAAALGSGWLLMHGKPRDAARIAIAAGTGALLGAVLQHVFDRTRPPEGRKAKSTSSFPSTHTLTATAAYGTAGVTLMQSDVAAERAVGAALLLILLPWVPTSRVLLGMHWASDVVASAALGGAIVAIACAS